MYTGISAFKVVGINKLGKNDNRWELKERHLDSNEKNGFKDRTIYIDVDNGDFKARFPIYLRKEPVVSKKTNKKQFIDKNGKVTIYVKDIKDVKAEDFDTGSLRPLLVGEEGYMSFMKILTGAEDENFLEKLEKRGVSAAQIIENPDPLTKMDLDKCNEVSLMCVVRENTYQGNTYKFQDLYTRIFGYASPSEKAKNYWKQHMEFQQKNGYFDGEYSIQYTEYVKTEAAPEAVDLIPEIEEDDLPF